MATTRTSWTTIRPRPSDLLKCHDLLVPFHVSCVTVVFRRGRGPPGHVSSGHWTRKIRLQSRRATHAHGLTLSPTSRRREAPRWRGEGVLKLPVDQPRRRAAILPLLPSSLPSKFPELSRARRHGGAPRRLPPPRRLTVPVRPTRNGCSRGRRLFSLPMLRPRGAAPTLPPAPPLAGSLLICARARRSI